MKEMNILLIAGATGSGKTFIRDMIYNHTPFSNTSLNFHIPLQVTTRNRRMGNDGNYSERSDDYMFINPEYYDYLKIENSLTTMTYFNKNSYGTLKRTLVSGRKNCNLIVASAEGIFNTLKDFEDDSDVVIKKMLVISNPDEIEDIIREHNGRSIEFAKNEIEGLLKIPFDVYIPNFLEKRITEEDLFEKIDFEKLFKRR